MNMPSRQLSSSEQPPPPPNQPQNPHRNRHNKTHHHRILAPLIASAASACSLVVLVILCIRNRTRRKKQRTTPSSDTDSTPPHRFSYSLLRRATNSFSTTLGHGGFGPVFSGSLAGKPVAVKLMDSSVSLQGEREFHNELFFASRLLRSSCRHVVPAIGFAVDTKRRRFLIVYELMHNGNLHDALLRRKYPELMRWEKRFSVAVDVAKGIQYLHSCDPPVIHGDIKPSNVLLDRCFEAKIGDFGLARLKTETQIKVEVLGGESEIKRKEELESDGGSVFEEQSPESFVAGASPAAVAVAWPSEVEGVESVEKNGKGVSGDLVNEGNEVAGAVVKDYVIDWIGNEVGKEREKVEWVDSTASTSGKEEDKNNNKMKMKNSRRKLEWWESMDEEMGGAGVLKKERRRPAREWWKEEYSAELEKKKKKKKKKNKQKGRKGAESDGDNGDSWWFRDAANLYNNDGKKMKRNSSRNSRGSVDSWLDGMSGELRRARGNSYDSCSGEIIPKSGCISSNQSMRGTVFYVAPEYGYSGDVSEKCDVYSYGVLLLVIVSGRRPLQVTGSPLSEFQRANLVSWARLCARNGKLLDLVDQSIESLDEEQALLCIRVALLCLLKLPARRPSMKEVVGMLTGELDPPQLPDEYSSSRFPLKSSKESH